jgi:hypothetical protein
MEMTNAKQKINDLIQTEGPISAETWPGQFCFTCYTNERKCKHFAIHDFHYFYCAGQESNNPGYPWPGAGKQLRNAKPDEGCPYLLMNERCVEIGREQARQKICDMFNAEIKKLKSEAINEKNEVDRAIKRWWCDIFAQLEDRIGDMELEDK